MFGVLRNFVWNVRLKGWSYVKNYAGVAASVGIIWGSGWYGIYKTRYVLNNIVASRALDRERSGAPEYLYYNDPAHEQTLLQLFQDKGWSIWPYIGKFARKWRRAVLQRLIEVARDGEPEERMRALRHIKHMKLLKDWEVCWVSQRLDASSAVRLARMGAGPRLLGAPPLPSPLRLLPPYAPLTCLARLHPNHQCLNIFLQKHIDDTHQEVQQLMDSEGSSSRNPPDEEEEIKEAVSAALHHFSGELQTNKDAVMLFVQEGGLALLSSAACSNDRDVQLAAARLLLCLSSHHSLLSLIHRTGLIQCLSKWLESTDAELSSLAGGTLAGLEGERWGNSEVYGPTVQLLHPTHLTKLPPKLDVVTVHGLLGEPFVTWRQRDDINEITEAIKLKASENNDDDCSSDNIEEEFEFVLRDLPETAIRDTNSVIYTHRGEKGIDIQERNELKERTMCWPRDWLPRDCPNIRVLGVSYDTVMTEWSEGECTVDCGGGLEQRARVLAEGLRRAGVGNRPTLWIAHSMGGLLVKQMLVHSLESEEETEKKLATNTWGMIFYSTPHHGTRAAHALLWPSREVQDLREDSSVLKKLHSVWLSGGWRCVCFAEGRSTKFMAGLPRLMLVPPASADAGTGPCYILPLNHLDICKPATRLSFIYRQAVEMIRHALGERCGAERCKECEHIGRIEDNYYVALYKLIRCKIKKILADTPVEQNMEEDNLQDSKDPSLQSWLLGIMPF